MSASGSCERGGVRVTASPVLADEFAGLLQRVVNADDSTGLGVLGSALPMSLQCPKTRRNGGSMAETLETKEVL